METDVAGAALSRRELEVAALVATGLTDQEIASRLFLSRRTAEGHVQSIRNKLGLDNRSQIAAWHTRRTAAAVPPGPPRPRSLPVPLTSFLNRDAERAAIRQFLARARTVTITGPAGAGKTRLALRVAEEVAGRFPEGAWFADLAALNDPGAILHQVAAALGVREHEGVDTLGAIAARAGRGCLILLDNCEHMVEAAALATSDLLQASPNLWVLCTSREPLLFDGEVVWRLAPLVLPADDSAPPSILQRSHAVQLLVDRAALSDPDFRLTEDNAAGVARLCRRLDGIPLALELAAAQVGPLGLSGVLDRLEDRFDFLLRRAAPARHQTLDAALRWSYELLDEENRRVLRAISIFRGGFSEEAALAVCGPAASRLPELAAKSLVSSGPGARRWSMLETIRRFAEAARTEGGETPALALEHAAFFRAVAERAEPELTGPGQGRVLAELEADHDNLRAALASAEPEGRLRLALALYRFWLVRGHLSEGRAAMEAALAAAPGDGPLQARALNALAGIAWRQGAYALARDCLEESLAAWRRLGDTGRLQPCLANLGVVAASQGDFESARLYYEESLELAVAAGEPHAVAVLESNLGLAAAETGDHAEAQALLDRSLAALRALNDGAAVGSTLVNLGLVHVLRGRPDLAQDAYTAALRVLAEVGDTPDAASCLEGLGWVAALQQKPELAVRLAGAAAAIRETIGAPASPAAQARLDRWLPESRAALPDRGDAAWTAGRDLTPVEAMRWAAAGGPSQQ